MHCFLQNCVCSNIDHINEFQIIINNTNFDLNSKLHTLPVVKLYFLCTLQLVGMPEMQNSEHFIIWPF